METVERARSRTRVPTQLRYSSVATVQGGKDSSWNSEDEEFEAEYMLASRGQQLTMSCGGNSTALGLVEATRVDGADWRFAAEIPPDRSNGC